MKPQFRNRIIEYTLFFLTSTPKFTSCQSRYFMTWIKWRKSYSWNWIGTKFGIESAMPHKMLIFKAVINFSPPADSCHIVCMLEMCRPTLQQVQVWPLKQIIWRRQFWNLQFLHMELMSTRNKFHSKNDFSQGINSRCLGFFKAVLGFRDILVGIRILGSVPWLMDPDPALDPDPTSLHWF